MVSELLLREIKDPRVAGMTSITRVEVAADVRQAKIFISVMGDEAARRDTLRALEHASGFIRSKLGEELTIRHVPAITFQLDRSLEQGDRVLALMAEVAPTIGPEPAPAARCGAGRRREKRGGVTAGADWAGAAALLRGAGRLLLWGHRKPDADAAGSVLGLAYALESLGKSVTLICSDPLEGILTTLPGAERFLTAPPADGTWDAVVSLDVSTADRLGPPFAAAAAQLAGLPFLNIDHHLTNPGFGTVNLVDPAAAATAEMVTLLLEQMGVPLTVPAATCLLAGLLTDTLSFQTESTTPAHPAGGRQPGRGRGPPGAPGLPLLPPAQPGQRPGLERRPGDAPFRRRRAHRLGGDQPGGDGRGRPRRRRRRAVRLRRQHRGGRGGVLPRRGRGRNDLRRTALPDG